MKDIYVRPFGEADRKKLNEFREGYMEADLEIPHGYMGPNVETAVSYKDGKIISALTGTLSITLDPFIKNPDASPTEVMQSLFKLEAALSYLGQKLGAVDIYIAIPNHLNENYGAILRRCGYEPTVQGCTVYRRPMIPDTEPLLGPARDEARRLQEAQELLANARVAAEADVIE